MNRILPYATLLLVIAVSGGRSSGQDEIRKRQAELESIRDQIAHYEQKIKEQQHNEKEVLDLLDSYDRKATLVHRLIARLRGQEQALQGNIDRTRAGVGKLEEQLGFLKAHYAHYVTSAYKAGRTHDFELLFSSASVNQFFVRTEYLKRFTDQRRKDAEKITGKKEEIEDTQARLQQQLSEERRLIAEKGAEEDRLAADAAGRRGLLGQIRKDKKIMQREIERQLKAARELESLITTLIEADRVKREREAEHGRLSRLPQVPATPGAFEAKRGKLPWPVAAGVVVARFGNQKHPTLRTITQNTGIDIAVKAGTPVAVVADGEVSKIWWLPSYGNLLIINHDNGYRTIYTHLVEINVTEGQAVKGGDVIATSGESIDGPRLHFEIWKDKEKQNPERWLVALPRNK